MGLFSKLFGETAKIIDDIASAKKQEADDRRTYSDSSSENIPADVSAPASADEGPSGFSWGPVMPDEENQFNYNGTFKEYFTDVFRSEFPSYNIEITEKNNGKMVIFTFREGARKALVVEILPSQSSVYKLRNDCKNEGIPYLRYYYDHHGWWNTREYVKQRTRSALMG